MNELIVRAFITAILRAAAIGAIIAATFFGACELLPLIY